MPSTLEVVLEAVSDAVSAIVLFASESDENVRMPNLLSGIAALAQAVDYMCTLAKKAADLWANIGRFDMQESMNKSITQLRAASTELSDGARSLAENLGNKAARKQMLRACKEIMTHTVALVQLADLYDVQKLIKDANTAARAAKTLGQVNDISNSFVQAASDFVTSSATVSTLCLKRLKNIEPGELYDRMSKHSDNVKLDCEKLLAIIRDCLVNLNNAGMWAEKEQTLRKFIDLINKVIEDTRLSARSPFDLSLLEGAEVIDYPSAIFLAGEDVIKGHQALSQALENYQNALRSGTPADILAAEQLLRDELLKQSQNASVLVNRCDDPEVKRKLESAARRIAANLDELFAKAQEAARRQAFEELENLLNGTRAASALVVEHAAKRLLLESEQKLLAKLEELTYDVEKGNSKAAVEDLKGITKEANFQADVARCISDGDSRDMDILRKFKIREEASNMETQPSKLVKASKELMVKFSESGVKELQAEIEKTKEISHSLVAMATMSAEAELLDNAGTLAENLVAMKKMLDTPNLSPNELAFMVRSSAKTAIRQTDLADQIAERTADVMKKQGINIANQNMRQQASAIVLATRSIIQNEPGAKETMRQVIESTELANRKIVQATALRPDDQMLELEAEILENLEVLNRAVKEGTDDEVERALKNLSKSLVKQGILARAIAENITDESQRSQIESAVNFVESLSKQISPLLNATRAQPGSKIHYDNFQNHMDQVKEGVSKVTQATASSVSQRMLANTKKLFDQLKSLDSSVEKQQEKETIGHLNKLKESLSVHSLLTSTLADQDLLRRKEILHSAETLSNLGPKIEKSALVAMTNVREKAEYDRVVESARAELVKLTSMAIENPEMAILENSRYIDSKLDSLVKAVKKGDQAEAMLNLKQVLNKLDQQILLANVIAEGTDSQEIKNKLQAYAKAIEQLSLDLERTTKVALQDPTKLNDLIHVVDEIKRQNSSLIATTKQNTEYKEQKKREEEERIRQEEIRKKQELERLKKLEQERIELEKREAERKRQEEAERIRREEEVRLEKIRQEKEELKRQMELQKLEAERRERAEAARLAAEKREMEERLEAERKLREEEAQRMKDDQVYLAAQAVTQRVQKANDKLGSLFPEFTGKGKLIDIANRIGELMKLLSIAANENNKTDMIKLSQQIAAAVKDINSQAAEQAALCTDPILKANLINTAQAVTSYSTQLKIISAVKATTENDGKSAKQQLVVCAKGLANAVISTVNAAESAAIRSKRN